MLKLWRMKTTSNLRQFIALSFFLITLHGFGQAKVEQYHSNGLSTTIFNTSEGKLTLYLPEYSPGETISGTIHISPDGTSSKKLQKNRWQGHGGCAI